MFDSSLVLVFHLISYEAEALDYIEQWPSQGIQRVQLLPPWALHIF